MSTDEGARPAFEISPAPEAVGLFDALSALDGVAHAVTTRHAVDPQLVRADPDAAGALLARRLGLDGLAFARQVHRADVLRVDAPGPAGEADALVTDRPGLGLMGFSADCPLILAADAGGGAVGAAHASWRGTVRRVAARLVEAMVREFSAAPGRIVACIGPGAGPCCYEVGPEVRDAAVEALGPEAQRFFRAQPGGAFLFDLWQANRAELLGAGLAPENVHAAGVCTICRNDLFPSYRVEADSAGRFAAVIGRTA